MPTNQESLYRQWCLLRKIPRYPKKITVKQVYDHLFDEGIRVTERTVQRDLNELSKLFPLVVDDREKPYGWSWEKNAKSFDLPGLNGVEALALILMEQHLSQMLPSSAVDYFSPYFKAAHERLNEETVHQHERSWLGKVRTVPPAQPLRPPVIKAEIYRILSEALLKERQLTINYRRKNEQQLTTYQLHPLALVSRGNILYLYARISDYPNGRMLALHRIECATMLEEPAVTYDGFDIDNSIEKGTWGFGEGNQFTVQLKFYDHHGDHLTETPLSADQIIQEEAEQGTLTVTATIADTPQLRWWILGFGASAEVIAPVALREELGQISRRMADRYLGESGV